MRATSRVAVTWSGLVYPLTSAGDPADLAADVTAFVAADDKARASWQKEHPESPFYRFRNARPEGAEVAPDVLAPLRAVLLLRLGETALAESVWTAWTAGMRADTNDDRTHLADPYLMLATDWTWSLYDRAVCAHMRGDDPLSLASALVLVPLARAVEAEASRRAFPNPAARPGESHLSFLDRLDDLVADESRRVSEPPRAPALDGGLPPNADKATRIDALVQDLDQVAARQWGQPGGVSLGDDPVVQALVAEGDDAVPKLLDCLEHDTRLTRSVHFWRDFARSRSLLSVGEAGYVALSGILDASFFGAASTGDDLSARGVEGRKHVADQIRAYWQKWKGVPLEERWYQTLASDDASKERWLEAAGNITQPDNVTVVRSSMVWSQTVSTSAPSTPKLRGESLRAKTRPSVTDLLARRTDALAVAPDGMPLANQMVVLLAAWDPKGALPALAKQMGRCLSAMRGTAPGDKARYAIAVARITSARVHAGERAALDAYAAWLGPLGPEDLGSSGYDLKLVLAPLAEFPTDAAVERASKAMFAASGSPWSSLTAGRRSNFWGVSDLVDSDLLHLPAFRTLVLRSLADNARLGTVKVQEGGGIHVELDNGGSMGTGANPGDNLPPTGTVLVFRAGDLVAWELAKHDGAPPFRLFWSAAARDAARAALARYVETL